MKFDVRILTGYQTIFVLVEKEKYEIDEDLVDNIKTIVRIKFDTLDINNIFIINYSKDIEDDVMTVYREGIGRTSTETDIQIIKQLFTDLSNKHEQNIKIKEINYRRF